MPKPFHVIATPDEKGYTVHYPKIRMCPPAVSMLPTLYRRQRNRTNGTGMIKPPFAPNAASRTGVIRQCHGQKAKRKSARNAEPVKC